MPETKIETGWIQTFTGKKVHPFALRVEDVCIRDVAHALAHVNRFGGHTKPGAYSVAQHSVLVAEHCRFPKLGLLHDAAEAYLGDLCRPLKQWLRQRGCTLFDDAEDAILNVILQKYGLAASCEEWAEVKRADTLLLVTEARDLMAPLHADWRHTPENGCEVLPDRITPWTAGKAEWYFLDCFRRLFPEHASEVDR